MGNPAIFPLLRAGETEDVLVVQINPELRDRTPTSSREILHRNNEITFNASLEAEMRALAFIQQQGESRNGAADIPRVNVHRIVLSGVGKKLTAGSRLNTDYDFFDLLYRTGRRTARHFLDEHFDDIGVRSTVDLSAEVAAEHA